MNGSSPETDMFAKYPGTPSESVSNTPRGPHRRIRCKMCRQELATREHMLDHGQFGPATPVHPLHTLRNMSRTSMDSTSALDTEDESETELNAFPANSSSKVTKEEDVLIDAAHISGLPLFDAIISTAANGRAQLEAQSKDGDVAEDAPPPVESPPTTHFINPSDLSSQLFSIPALAALRSANSPVSPSSINSPPILLNTKCSGYFVEPMKWMEHFLSGGQLAGKIICPNKKCTAKLGNYDWAGVCCECKQWVTLYVIVFIIIIDVFLSRGSASIVPN